MADSVSIVYGRPSDLEEQEFQNQAGETVHSLSFKLKHPALSLGWPVLCEARDDELKNIIRGAHETGDYIHLIAVPRSFRKDGDEGQKRDWVKFSCRAFLEV